MMFKKGLVLVILAVACSSGEKDTANTDTDSVDTDTDSADTDTGNADTELLFSYHELGTEYFYEEPEWIQFFMGYEGDDDLVIAPLFEDVEGMQTISVGDVGEWEVDATSDADFADFEALFTNGVDEWWLRFNIVSKNKDFLGYAGTLESEWVGAGAKTDLVGYDIESVKFILDLWTYDSAEQQMSFDFTTEAWGRPLD